MFCQYTCLISERGASSAALTVTGRLFFTLGIHIVMVFEITKVHSVITSISFVLLIQSILYYGRYLLGREQAEDQRE